MLKHLRKALRKDGEPAKVPVVNPATEKEKGAHATLVAGVTDEDPNTGRRIARKRKK